MRIGKCEYCKTEQKKSKFSLFKSLNIKICGGCNRFLNYKNKDFINNKINQMGDKKLK